MDIPTPYLLLGLLVLIALAVYYFTSQPSSSGPTLMAAACVEDPGYMPSAC